MYRTDRSAAPLGLALFFLSLAIVPVSLRVAGYDVSLSPSLAAAVEAWRGIAGILGNSSQSASDTELSLIKKYSFAEGAKPVVEERAVAESCSRSLEPNTDLGEDFEVFRASEIASGTAAAASHRSQRARFSRSPATRKIVVANRVRQAIASRPPVLVRSLIGAEAKSLKYDYAEGALLRVSRELLRRSRSLNEALKAAQLQRDVEVFVKMKPVALFGRPRLLACEEDQWLLGEPATEVFRGLQPRFSFSSSEDPYSFEF